VRAPAPADLSPLLLCRVAAFNFVTRHFFSHSYVHVINSERAAAASELLGLESLGWIDNLTRALAVELSTFTPGSNIFSTLTLVRAPRSSAHPVA
jgi:hypothetical protein